MKLVRPKPTRLDLELAGEARFVFRYEDIVTAITNPRHVMNERYRVLLEQSRPSDPVQPFMPHLANEMTVQQLIDVVAFCHGVYREQLAEYSEK